MPKKSRGEANIGNIPSGQVQRVGNVRKLPLMDGAAGRGEVRDLGNRKWNKEGRDNPNTEKEAGKSRSC